jgi:hypothetical protein
MPKYQKIDVFMTFVKAVNPRFEKVKTSSLRPLINILNNNSGTAQQAGQALSALPGAKATKYRKALYYLLGSYPGLEAYAQNITFANLGKLNAARFTRTALPDDYDPQLPKLDRIVPPSSSLNITVEQYLFSNADAGIILIHMSDHDDGMDQVFEGDSCLDHIRSVLHVAKKMRCDVCTLYMKDGLPVLPALATEYADLKSKCTVTEVLEKNKHMGTTTDTFLQFAQNHNKLVVIGFDGVICVPANLFGGAEKTSSGSWALPLTTISTIVTSRAIIVSKGQLYTTFPKPSWGCLNLS